jgi:hypothetical protein
MPDFVVTWSQTASASVTNTACTWSATGSTTYYQQPIYTAYYTQPQYLLGTSRVMPPGTREGWKPPGSEKARKRARKLLLSLLDARQRREFEQHGHFHVHLHTADGERRYRIRDYKGVERVDERGRVLRRYCIHPPTDFPAEDTAVAQLMLLETDEAEFLRVANEEIVTA